MIREDQIEVVENVFHIEEDKDQNMNKDVDQGFVYLIVILILN